MKFRKAVEQTAEIADHLRTGLEALDKSHRDRVEATYPKRLEGSVNIDAALQPAYPNATRWDYAIGYRLNSQKDKVFFVEFHKAEVTEVSRVLQKKAWLDSWMRGQPMDQLRDRKYVWLSAGGIKIPRNAPQRRELNMHGLRLERRLRLE
jgi:mRNA-degrading endonuclease RelE of RelBE toxin-antitoxin system